jgi:ribonuclease-3
MDDDTRIERLEVVLGVVFHDRELALTALTHPSYTAENPGDRSYERLEFLGDAVLGFVTAEALYRSMPDSPEGELTRQKITIVAGTTLAAVAERIGLGDLVRLGRGAERSGGRNRTSILENVLEACFAAVYLDGGLDPLRGVVTRLLGDLSGVDGVSADDPKSLLQERAQARGIRVAYRIASEDGLPHDRWFEAEVLLDDKVHGRGKGRTKKDAEKEAATAALGHFKGGRGSAS